MSFQDLQHGKTPSSSSPSSASSISTTPAQEVAAGIFQINTAVAGFRRLVDGLGTAKDTLDHRRKLHNTRQRILHLVKETSGKLKVLSESDHNIGISAGKKIEDAKLARDFQTILQEFQKVQQLSTERESTYSPSLPQFTSGSEEYVAPSVDQERQPFVQAQKRQELLLLDNEISFNDAIIDEREQGIREIEEQIGQTSEIFKDLAVLVHDQGIIIDDIHSNIDASAAATSQSKVQLSRASKSVKSRSSWCWWVLAVVVLALIIFLLILIL